MSEQYHFQLLPLHVIKVGKLQHIHFTWAISSDPCANTIFPCPFGQVKSSLVLAHEIHMSTALPFSKHVIQTQRLFPSCFLHSPSIPSQYQPWRYTPVSSSLSSICPLHLGHDGGVVLLDRGHSKCPQSQHVGGYTPGWEQPPLSVHLEQKILSTWL